MDDIPSIQLREERKRKNAPWWTIIPLRVRAYAAIINSVMLVILPAVSLRRSLRSDVPPEMSPWLYHVVPAVALGAYFVVSAILAKWGFQTINRLGWFRFQLRTLFVLVTLICIFCGYFSWAMNWKRQRREFASYRNKLYAHTESPFSLPTRAPIWLWPLGEPGYVEIVFDRDATEQKLEEAARLFPEAEIKIDTNLRIIFSE
jgi:hypothetical protein